MEQPLLSTSGGLGFDLPVTSNGYRWWYVDGFSDCGSHGVTLIFFIGTVFSPFYAAARAKGDTDPRDFVCVNAVFYERGHKHWAMTERRARDLSTSSATLTIGPSSMVYDGQSLTVNLDERSAPFRRAIRGKVVIDMPELTKRCYALHSGSEHRWWPIAPTARVKVSLSAPNLNWEGGGYVDSNGGTVPLETTFSDWHWSRADMGSDNCRIVYEAKARDGETCLMTLFGNTESGMASEHSAPRRDLSMGPIWRVSRPARSYQGFTVEKTLEDTPFYTRSHLRDASGNSVMHESLDLDRFTSPWVQRLLPFRMRKIFYGFTNTSDSRVTVPFSKSLK
jgi:carotenoid 1,2-hydratase